MAPLNRLVWRPSLSSFVRLLSKGISPLKRLSSFTG